MGYGSTSNPLPIDSASRIQNCLVIATEWSRRSAGPAPPSHGRLRRRQRLVGAILPQTTHTRMMSVTIRRAVTLLRTAVRHRLTNARDQLRRVAYSTFERRRRRVPAIAASPSENSTMDAGSGTGGRLDSRNLATPYASKERGSKVQFSDSEVGQVFARTE
jgi:hypothetical protein